MKKVCLMFPGQGSQSVGMGKDLYDKYPNSREIFDLAGDELKKIIFQGPEEILKLTQWTQPAIFTVSLAAFKAFEDNIDISNFEFVSAGHSLGEYSALCAAGFFDFADGIKMVKARGSFLQKASEQNKGIMAAVLGLASDKVEEVCKQASCDGICEPVNFNCPGQIVIAGTVDGVNKAIELAKNAGALKCVILNVSGPFHSSLMKPASEAMARELEKYSFSKPKFPVYTNCDAALTSDISDIKNKLVKQINNAVKWNESINNIINSNFDIFIEIGPGKILSGLLRKIDRSKKAFNIEDSASLDKTLSELNK
ncbi:MAG: ACP S-malonyltransferase [Elusimicrobiota bacterium]|jgi:[acyl-carrier-protein] S-malonyltransferase|nr:ACP S-malonyltransferase [Elusimicrobiota bacterium]